MVDRWQGFFETPNQAALGIALALVVLVAVSQATVAVRHAVAKGVVLTGIWLGISGCVILLAATGSRAGWLASIAGLLVLWIAKRKAWKEPVTAALALVVAIALCPGAIARVEIIPGEVVHGERQILWASALAIIHDHPWSGVGAAFPRLLDDWYLPSNLEHRFATALRSCLETLIFDAG